jgi:glycosyltransferase involved in cell wall biosynthesis
VLGLAAVLIPEKCVDVAIEAIRQLQGDMADRVVLLVIGDGTDRAALEQQAKGLPVIFVGYRDDVHDLLLNVVDLFLLPSEMEPFGISLLEAAAARLPRIGTAAGGIPEQLSSGIDGLLVPVRDPSALADAIRLLVTDPERAKRLGEAGYRRLRTEFTPQRFLEAFAALYDEMTKSPASRAVRIGRALGSIWHQLRLRLRRS